MHNAETITLPVIDPKILEEIKAEMIEEKQVIIHCLVRSSYFPGTFIRIWPSTFITSVDGNIKKQMIHHEKIVLAPDWLMVPFGLDYSFTLIFPGLPKHCQTFHFLEMIDEEGAFAVRNIPRNQTDVYTLRLI